MDGQYAICAEATDCDLCELRQIVVFRRQNQFHPGAYSKNELETRRSFLEAKKKAHRLVSFLVLNAWR